jgi:hypothetical protein
MFLVHPFMGVANVKSAIETTTPKLNELGELLPGHMARQIGRSHN